MTHARTRQIIDAVEDALLLVQDYAVPADVPAEPLPSLLEECRQLIATPQSAPLRLVHHFACTGGSLICKCLAALPNTLLLSEIDPLSTLAVTPRQPTFAPTDLVINTRYAMAEPDEALLVDIFLGGLTALRDGAERRGKHLVLRDHAHSQFCVARDPADRPTLRDIIPPDMPRLSVVTLRHPLDSYLALRSLGWHGNMQPATIGEYARRYLAFLGCHDGVPRLRYEDFLADPPARLADLCRWLDLPYAEEALHLFPTMHVSGESGRMSAMLAPRPRRPIPADLAEEIAASTDLHHLCAVTGYEPGV